MADPMNFPHTPSFLDTPTRVSDAEWARQYQTALASIAPEPYVGDTRPAGWRRTYENQMRGQALVAELKAEIMDVKGFLR